MNTINTKEEREANHRKKKRIEAARKAGLASAKSAKSKCYQKGDNRTEERRKGGIKVSSNSEHMRNLGKLSMKRTIIYTQFYADNNYLSFYPISAITVVHTTYHCPRSNPLITLQIQSRGMLRGQINLEITDVWPIVQSLLTTSNIPLDAFMIYQSVIEE